MIKKRALVICPGRGTYNKDELGYYHRHHSDRMDLIGLFDDKRGLLGQEKLSALDGAERYSLARHTRGDNASALIYACALADFEAIDQDQYDIAAVTGNSMGWYIGLAAGGVLSHEAGFEVINTMGSLMQQSLIGGQLIYPFVDQNWVEIPNKREELIALTHDIAQLSISIYLGGMIVFAGTEAALSEAEKRLPPVMDRFPMRLQNHAGFHSPLQASVSTQGFDALALSLFDTAHTPLIDGRGHIWYPHCYETRQIYDYTLGHQVVAPYDFTTAIGHGLREFAPDVLIVLGPGNTLGGAVAQSMIEHKWQGIVDKASFTARQDTDPILLAMDHDEQRQLAI